MPLSWNFIHNGAGQCKIAEDNFVSHRLELTLCSLSWVAVQAQSYPELDTRKSIIGISAEQCSSNGGHYSTYQIIRSYIELEDICSLLLL